MFSLSTSFGRCGLTVFALLKLCRYHQQENIRVRHVTNDHIILFPFLLILPSK